MRWIRGGSRRSGWAIAVPRSIVFYAWLGFAVQFLLIGGVVAFVLTGAAYQRNAVLLLSQRVQHMQLSNLSLNADFLNTQRALRGYQATGQARFAQTFFASQQDFVQELATLRALAWPGVVDGVVAQEEAARQAFLLGGQAVLAAGNNDPSGAAKLYDQVSASSDAFARRNQLLAFQLATSSAQLADRAQRTLGVGMTGTSVIVAVGLMLPVLAFGLALRWTSTPLHGITTTVRQRALGENQIRAPVGGPADVRELARSVNFLADESERLRGVREASARIYEHLNVPAIASAAMAALRDNLAVDAAWVGLVSGDQLSAALDGPAPQGSPAASSGSVRWARDLYARGTSYCHQDLRAGIPPDLPPQAEQMARAEGASCLLLTPFGVGGQLGGILVLVRVQGRPGWTGPEIEAVESLARDLGRAIEHARLYESEQRHVAELESLNRAKTGFLASSSHDLRTPLTSIVGYVEMLKDEDAGPVNTRQSEMLAAVHRNGLLLEHLIEDMLTISKIQLGVFSSELRPIDLAPVVAGLARFIAPEMEGKGIALDVCAPAEGLMINGDAGQLDQVVMNLLTNAMKYTPAGGSVTCSAAADHHDAALVVQDTGMGIPQGEQGSVGTPFFRASNAASNAIPGSGLGLSIVYTVIGHHNGTIELESAVGKGTKVTVRIPLLGPAAPSAAPQAEEDVT
jgi:two-component system, OmpR family, phosphate regulon sensor histidine kinase PhoR